MYDLQVAVDVRLFGYDLDMYLCGADLQIADKGIDDVPLLELAAEAEIDRADFQDTDIPVIARVNAAVCNLFDREIICHRIGPPVAGSLHRRDMRSYPGFRGCVGKFLCKISRCFGGFMRFLTLCARFRLCFCCVGSSADHTFIALEMDKPDQEGRKAFPGYPDQRKQCQRKRRDANDDDFCGEG